MDQFNQIDNVDPFLSQPPLSPPPTNASDALALPPLATYPSREALFEAIQSWAKARGYALTIASSKRVRNGRQKVYYACDRCPKFLQVFRLQRLRPYDVAVVVSLATQGLVLGAQLIYAIQEPSLASLSILRL